VIPEGGTRAALRRRVKPSRLGYKRTVCRANLLGPHEEELSDKDSKLRRMVRSCLNLKGIPTTLQSKKSLVLNKDTLIWINWTRPPSEAWFRHRFRRAGTIGSIPVILRFEGFQPSGVEPFDLFSELSLLPS
jgi:hypothetical protein